MGSPDQDRESYFRWQEFAIRQLGYVINLMMTLSGGALAFAIREKIEGYVKLDGCAWRLAVLSLAISVIAAVAANVTRALDFRYTRRAARARMKRQGPRRTPRDRRTPWRLDVGLVLLPGCDLRFGTTVLGVVAFTIPIRIQIC